ncbi:hypothetical protein HY500_04400 [Candidatus Woesearchaeota archaeon]|nr:hypothetical protein [Candidatus Woesearchaeota archaeon]
MPNGKELEIGRLISLEFERRKLNPAYVGSILYSCLGFGGYLGSDSGEGNIETGELYVQLVLNGFIYGSDSHVARVLKRETRLDRLAILLFAIGVEPNDPLIERISEQDVDFVYPPSKGIPFSALRVFHTTLEILAEETASNQELVDRIQGYFVELGGKYSDEKTPVKVMQDLLNRVESLSGYRISFEKI